MSTEATLPPASANPNSNRPPDAAPPAADAPRPFTSLADVLGRVPKEAPAAVGLETPAEPATEAAAEASATPEPTKAAAEPAKPTLSQDEMKRREQSIALAAEKRKIAQERDGLTAELKEYREWKTLKDQKDAWGQLRAMGWDKPELFTAALAEGAMTPERKELLEIRNTLAAKEQKEAEARYAQQLDSARRQAVEFLSKDDRFELTRMSNGPDTVLQVMSQHYEATKDPVTGVGETMSFEEAAQHVESYLEAELEKILNVGKVQKKLGAKAASAKPSPSATRETPRSLSNKMSATTATPPEMTEEERIRNVADGLKKMFEKRG
jgi:hypothetical protein